MSTCKWVRSSLRQLSKSLDKQGYQANSKTIARLLKKQGYRLKANFKRFTGASHPDRNKQFTYIETLKQTFIKAGLPVISVDTKKKELVGNFKNNGQAWCSEADVVNAHDFRQKGTVRAVPYGIYNLNHNRGYVYVGVSGDTAEFSVEAIKRWWQSAGKSLFKEAKYLLIFCDAGGSNSSRSRLWKYQLQKVMADCLGINVIVCHYPSGASKWNPVEHRLFSYISINWAGKPLRTLETMLAYIRGTTTETGLIVEAELIEGTYQTGLKVSDRQMKQLNLKRHFTCPAWNYTIKSYIVNQDEWLFRSDIRFQSTSQKNTDKDFIKWSGSYRRSVRTACPRKPALWTWKC